jgi:hypothetical protein
MLFEDSIPKDTGYDEIGKNYLFKLKNIIE